MNLYRAFHFALFVAIGYVLFVELADRPPAPQPVPAPVVQPNRPEPVPVPKPKPRRP